MLLAPVAMVSGALGLGESIVPVLLAHPTSWLLLGPAMLALGSSCLVAFDAMAEDLGVGRRLRIVLCWMEAVVIFQVVAMWGHPEDMLALALALYALLGAFRARWSLAGWLWGAAIVIQPLVALAIIPVFVGIIAITRISSRSCRPSRSSSTTRPMSSSATCRR